MRRFTASIVVVVGVLAAWSAQAQSSQKVLRIVPPTDLRILDPIWTTADITRDYGYMVFDTLFALDGQAKPQPQMVDTWTVSDDKQTYVFTLRDGLRLHDGTPVRAGAGVNVDLQAMDWGTLTSRRSSKEPIDKGGWNIFHTTFSGWEIMNPTVNSPLRSNGDGAYFGWPADDKIEQLRDAWLKAPDRDSQKQIATELQLRAYETVPYIVVGQFASVMAYRKNVTGIIKAPVLILWNVEKTG